MKHFKLILALGAVIGSTFFASSCKKGPNDPFLSFRSRDARLLGTWKLTAYTYKSVSTSISGSTINTTVTDLKYQDGLETTTTTSSGGSSSTSTNRYNYSMTFDKEGKWSHNTDFLNAAGTAVTTHYDGDGNWMWGTGKKNKESVVIKYLGSGDVTNSNSYGPLVMDQLKHKTMVCTRHIRVKSTSGTSSSEATLDFSYTFELQK